MAETYYIGKLTGEITKLSQLENDVGFVNHLQINGVELAGNKTSEDLGLMSNANFLPDGYTINLKADGTGDFETIQAAINFLNGKWSNGTVTIYLNAGTYNVSSPVKIGNWAAIGRNIPCILIKGKAMSDTIINNTSTSQYTACMRIYNGSTIIENLTIKNATKSSTNYSIKIEEQSRVYLDQVKLQNGEFGCSVTRVNDAVQLNNCTIDNTTYAVYAAEGGTVNLFNSTITVTNSITALRVWSGGQINIGYATKNFTNVTNETNQTIGSITADGMILGRWQN